jgi:hypothetical protein
MIIAVVVASAGHTSKTPSIHLTSKRRVTTMTKVKREHAVFKSLLLQDPPATSVRQPCNNVCMLGVGKNEMELDREGRILSSSGGHGLSN